MIVFKNVDTPTLRALLDLADDPGRDVATTTEYERLAVIVPDYLAERFARYQALESSPPKGPKKGSKQ